MPGDMASIDPHPPRARRADAERNAAHVIEVAVELLQAEPDASLEELAAAAGVSRATLYRHFGSRSALVEAARTHARANTDANDRDALRPPGELAGGPNPFDVADVLNKVPPHLLGEQVVAEAQRIAGVSSAAIYLVDLDGLKLRRLAGPVTYPLELPVPLAVGTEIPREGIPALQASI